MHAVAASIVMRAFTGLAALAAFIRSVFISHAS